MPALRKNEANRMTVDVDDRHTEFYVANLFLILVERQLFPSKGEIIFIDCIVIIHVSRQSHREVLVRETCLDACKGAPLIEFLTGSSKDGCRSTLVRHVYRIEPKIMAIEYAKFFVWINCARRGISNTISGCVDRVRHVWILGMVEQRALITLA